MNYKTGNYITFHTPEQWNQIVEKLERDGQLFECGEWNSIYKALNLANLGRGEKWFRTCELDIDCQIDITNNFFKELEQEELCKNPPLEAGDWFKIRVGGEVLEGVIGNTLNNHEGVHFKMSVKDVNSGKDLDYEILEYKPANPVKEYAVAPRGHSKADSLKFFQGVWVWNDVLKEECKYYINMVGYAIPTLYKLTLTKAGLDLIMKLHKYKGFCLSNYGEFCVGDTIIIDMDNRSILSVELVNLPCKLCIGIKLIEDLEELPEAESQKLNKISDSHAGLYVEALDYIEYRKWVDYVKSYRLAKLEAEKEYLSECFKLIEEIK